MILGKPYNYLGTQVLEVLVIGKRFPFILLCITISHKVLVIGTILIFTTTFSLYLFSSFLLCLGVGIGLTLRVGKLCYEPLAKIGAVVASVMLLVFRLAIEAIFSTTLLLSERLLVISRHAATKASLKIA
jgi:hypothetical protein